jgi:type VI secretion system protein ImpI/type VI secretion system protein
MALTLSVLRCPDAATPETRSLAGGDCTLGRAPDCDWVLADPDRVLSKRHCVFEFRSGLWQVRDLSTNGTYVNGEGPIGRDRARPLQDGDRVRLGAWEIEARIGEASASAGWGAPAGAAWAPSGAAWAPEAAPDPFADPLGPPRAPDIFAAPLPGLAPAAPPASLLPVDRDPFAEPPAMPDHAPSTADAFLAPRAAPGWGAPAAGDPFAGLPDPFAEGPPPAAAPLPDPFALGPPPTAAAAPGAPDPFASLPDPFAGAPRAAPAAPAAPRPPDPFADDPLAAAPPAPAAAALPPDAALAAFCRGAGLAPPPGADPAATLAAAGAALRAATAGLRALLIARADVKRAFRIEQTLLRQGANNPVKFAADDEQALLGLLAGGRGGAAIGEVVADLEAHQVATLAATQAAARALLERLAPAALEENIEATGFFAAREKKLWEAYRKLHEQLAAQFDDDFDSAFGKAFARAYERASKGGS